MEILLALDDKDHYIHNDLKKYLRKLGEVTVVDLKKINLPEKTVDKTIQKAIKNTTDSKQDILDYVISRFQSMRLHQFLPTNLRNPEFDLAFIYTEREKVLLKALLLGEHLKKSDIRMYHDPKLVLNNSHDKWNVKNILKNNKLPVPETYLTSLDELKSGGKEFLDKFPQGIVLKSRIGGGGEQVFRALNKSELGAAIGGLSKTEFINYFKKSVIIQPFYELEGNADIRLVIVGDEYVGAFKRVAGSSWKTNVAQGGTVESYEPSKAEINLCFQAIEVLRLKHAGFDLFPVAGKVLIDEVNVNLGYKGLAEVTGNNLMEYIIDTVKMSSDFEA